VDGVLKKTLTRQFAIISVELNPEIPDEEFELAFDPGTVVNDEIAGEVYLVPSGAATFRNILNEELSLIADQLREDILSDDAQEPSPVVMDVYKGGRDRPTPAGDIPMRGSWLNLIIVVVAAILLVGLIVFAGSYYAHSR